MIDPNQFGFEEFSDTHVGGPSALQKAGGKLIDRRGVSWLEAPQWQPQSCFWHGFSTRSAEVAEFNLGFTQEAVTERVDANRERYIEALTGRPDVPLFTVRQIHSNKVVVVTAGNLADRTAAPAADGLITNRRGILLGILTADCIPVLIADTKRHAVGAFHAGWRGTVAAIAEAGVRKMQEEYGSQPEDMIAAIGPGIGACCYRVGSEVRCQFEARFLYGADLFETKRPVSLAKNLEPGGTPAELAGSDGGAGGWLDLTEANRRQLVSAGLKDASISIVGGCTSCRSEIFYSHRASAGRAGRMMAVIGIR